MSGGLASFIAGELARPVPDPVRAFAQALGAERDAAAVLFYGSNLRTGDLSGVLDFYVLTRRPHRRGLRGGLEKRLWPEIAFRERDDGGRTLRAKVATMPLAVFEEAATGARRDSTIWTRFVQPAALAWSADDASRARVVDAVCAAAKTAARVALATGPREAPADAYWQALFAATYRAEFRVERAGREGQILAFAQDRFAALLPLAWQDAGIPFDVTGASLAPHPDAAERARIERLWRRVRRWGRPLNLARLAKAAIVTEGAGRYAAWKLDRHGALGLSPWQRRHPVLASPVILWRLWRRRDQAEAA